MILKMFSIRDQKADVYNTPYFKATLGEAERDFKTAVNDPKTMFHAYPEDYDLYFMGTYDDNKGLFMPVDTPQHICKAVSLLKQKSSLAEA